MDTLIALLDIVAWPVTVLILGFFFRTEVRSAFRRLSSLKYKDIEARFEKGLREAERRVQAVELPAEEQRSIEADTDMGSERLERIVEYSPRAAIVESWIDLEQAATEAATATGIYVEGRGPRVRTMRGLLKKGAISEDVLATYNQLRQLRNEAAHAPDFLLDYSEAERYLQLSHGLAAYLRYIARNRKGATTHEEH